MNGSTQGGVNWMPDHVRLALLQCLQQRSTRRMSKDNESVGSLRRHGSGSSIASSPHYIPCKEKGSPDGFKVSELSSSHMPPCLKRESSEDMISDVASDAMSFSWDPESMKVVRLEGCKSEIGSVVEDAWPDDDSILNDARTEVDNLKTRLAILEGLVAEAMGHRDTVTSLPPTARTETSISSTGLPMLAHQNSMSSLASHRSLGRTMEHLARIEDFAEEGSFTTDSTPPKLFDDVGGATSAILIRPQSRSSLDNLDDILITKVMSFLSVVDITRLSMTCKNLRRAWRENADVMVLGDSSQSGQCPCSTPQYLEGKPGYPYHSMCPYRPSRCHDDYDLRERRRSVLPGESGNESSNQMFALTKIETAICSWGLNTKLACLEIHRASITDNGLLILSKLDNIKRLAFVRCHLITQEPLRSSLAKMKVLEVLIVDHCKQIDPMGLMDVVSRKVKTLELTSKQPINDAQLNMFTEAILNNDHGACEIDELTLVTASTERCISNITMQHFFSAGVRHLRSLLLHSMMFINDDALKMIGQYMDCIEVLSVAHCPLYTSAGLKYISQKRTLRTLDLTGNHNLNEEGIGQLIGLRNLKVLVLADSSVDTACVERLSVLRNLDVLDIRGCDVVLSSRAGSHSTSPSRIFSSLNSTTVGALHGNLSLNEDDSTPHVTLVSRTLSVSGRRYSAVRKTPSSPPFQSGPLSTKSSSSSAEHQAQSANGGGRTLKDIAANNNYGLSDL